MKNQILKFFTAIILTGFVSCSGDNRRPSDMDTTDSMISPNIREDNTDDSVRYDSIIVDTL